MKRAWLSFAIFGVLGACSTASVPAEPGPNAAASTGGGVLQQLRARAEAPPRNRQSADAPPSMVHDYRTPQQGAWRVRFDCPGDVLELEATIVLGVFQLRGAQGASPEQVTAINDSLRSITFEGVTLECFDGPDELRIVGLNGASTIKDYVELRTNWSATGLTNVRVGPSRPLQRR